MDSEKNTPRAPSPAGPVPGSGDLVEVVVHDLAAGGDGVGRMADGRVVFVPLTAPGDRVRVRLGKVRARHAHGEIDALLEAAPERVAPPCEAFGECGGCSWQHLDYARQCEAKRSIVEAALRRVGKLELPGEIVFTPSPQPYGYRARARLAVEGGRVGYRRRRSNELRAVSACPVLEPELEACVAGLAKEPPERDGDWEIARGTAGVSSHRAAARGDAITLQAGPDALRISPGVFFQANRGLHDALLAAVAAGAGRGALALELHAGAGFFTLGLARAFGRVIAVEGSTRAVADLRHNLQAAGLGNVDVRHAAVEGALAQYDVDPSARPDTVLLDPPRTGLEPGDAGRIAGLAPGRIVYLSCDPATLARDLKAWVGSGYTLESVQAFDLFPQTPHVEVLACLGRAADAG